VSWIKRVKAAFQKLKNLNVRNQEVKQWGIRVVDRLLKSIGLDKRLGCPPREVEHSLFISPVLLLELRVPFCEDKDIDKMWEAVRIVAREALDLTPRDTGRLQNSQRTDVKMEGKETVLGIVEYRVMDVYRSTTSGNITFYALAVHNRDAYHGRDRFPNNPPRATWKFLEKAWDNKFIQNKVRGLFR